MVPSSWNDFISVVELDRRHEWAICKRMSYHALPLLTRAATLWFNMLSFPTFLMELPALDALEKLPVRILVIA